MGGEKVSGFRKDEVQDPQTFYGNLIKSMQNIYHHIPSTYVHVSFLSVGWARLGFPNAYKL